MTARHRPQQSGPGGFRRYLPRTRRGRITLVPAVLMVVVLGVAAAAGFFDRDPIHLIGAFGRERKPLGVLFYSGDMGIRFGAGRPVTRALAARGIPVVALNSSTAFATRRTRAEVDATVAASVRDALQQSNADKLVLVGQSFGSDMLATGLVSLPLELRPRIASIILVVPGESIFFRADPTNFTYHGKPDATARDAMRGVDWVPVTCISGDAETDSLCPHLRGANVRHVTLPGGHFLNNDHPRLIGVVIAAIGDSSSVAAN